MKSPDMMKLTRMRTMPGFTPRLLSLPWHTANVLRVLGQSPSHVGYIGWMGHQNLGDEALFQVISSLLAPAKLFPYTLSAHEIRLLRLLKPDKTFRAMCLGGGTLIGSPDFLTIVEDAISHSIPVFSFGTGCLDPYFWSKNAGRNLYLAQWKKAISQFTFVSVRGSLSAVLLDHLGIKGVKVVGDAVLAFAEDTIVDRAENLVLGVNLGTPGDRLLWGSDLEAVVGAVAENLKLLSSRGWRFRLFGVCSDDQPVLRHLAELVGSCYIQCSVLYDDPYDFMADAGKCCVFLGMKLHATTLAYSAFTPVIMLEYRPKCRDFMSTMGRVEYNVRTDHITSTGLADLVEQARSERDRLRQEQFALCQEYKQKLRSFVYLVLSHLGFSNS